MAVARLSLPAMISPDYRTVEAYTESKKRSAIGNTKLENAVAEANKVENRQEAYTTISSPELKCDNSAPLMEFTTYRGKQWIKFEGETIKNNPNQARIQVVNGDLVSLDRSNREPIKRRLYERFDLGENGWNQAAIEKESEKELVRIGLARLIVFNLEAWPSDQFHLFYAVLKAVLKSFDSKKHGDSVISALPWDSKEEDHERERERIVTAPLSKGVSTATSLASASTRSRTSVRFEREGSTAAFDGEPATVPAEWMAHLTSHHQMRERSSLKSFTGTTTSLDYFSVDPAARHLPGSASLDVVDKAGADNAYADWLNTLREFHRANGEYELLRNGNFKNDWRTQEAYAVRKSKEDDYIQAKALFVSFVDEHDERQRARGKATTYPSNAPHTSQQSYQSSSYPQTTYEEYQGAPAAYPSQQQTQQSYPTSGMDEVETGMRQATIEDDNRSQAPSSSRRRHHRHGERSRHTPSTSERDRNYLENYWKPKTVTQARADSPRFKKAFKPIEENKNKNKNKEERYHLPGPDNLIWHKDGDKDAWVDLKPFKKDGRTPDMKPGNSDGFRFQRTTEAPDYNASASGENVQSSGYYTAGGNQQSETDYEFRDDEQFYEADYPAAATGSAQDPSSGYGTSYPLPASSGGNYLSGTNDGFRDNHQFYERDYPANASSGYVPTYPSYTQPQPASGPRPIDRMGAVRLAKLSKRENDPGKRADLRNAAFVLPDEEAGWTLQRLAESAKDDAERTALRILAIVLPNGMGTATLEQLAWSAKSDAERIALHKEAHTAATASSDESNADALQLLACFAKDDAERTDLRTAALALPNGWGSVTLQLLAHSAKDDEERTALRGEAYTAANAMPYGLGEATLEALRRTAKNNAERIACGQLI